MSDEIKAFAAWASVKLYEEGDELWPEPDSDDSIDRAVQGGKSVGIQKAAMRLLDLAREYNEQ